jgi:putative SOS response-associated peptidase YedK
MKPIHDKMPVIIPKEQCHNWLVKDADKDKVFALLCFALLCFALLKNQVYEQMTATPISGWVNNLRHDDESCIKAS